TGPSLPEPSLGIAAPALQEPAPSVPALLFLQWIYKHALLLHDHRPSRGRFGRRIRCDYGNFRVADCSNMPACDVSKERPTEMKSGILDKLAFFIVIRAGKRGSRPCSWLALGATTVDAISRCRAQPCAGHPPFASPPGGLKARGPSPAKTIRANGAADLHNRISLRGQRCASRE